VDGDTVLVANGTYTGDGNRDIDFTGKAIVVMSENGPEVTIIDCENSGRGFYFHSGEDLSSVVQGFTITNGWIEGYPGGGGMYNDGGSPTVTNCMFTRNSADWDGGGMYNDGGSPTVTNCTFSGNTATFAGGGMNNNGGSPMVSNCTFSGNSTVSYDGGGMRNNGSSPTVTNCTFIGNTANRSGGGMRNWDNSPTVTNCTFIENSAGFNGGGMRNQYSSHPTVTNCTFIGNTATYNGGGMYNENNSNPSVSNCTFSGNSAGSYGGGMYNDGGSPTVTNCIFWSDLPNEISGDSSIVTYSDVEGGYTGEGNIDEDPMFVLADNDDYRLLWGSPCIDSGDPNMPLDADGTRCDMGAHYFNQDDYLTLYLTPDMTEVAPGGQLGVTYTLINRWSQSEPFWGLTRVILPGGNPYNLIGPDQFTLPANTTIQQHLNHNVPPSAPLGQYEYWTQIGIPPSTLYDDDRFTFSVVE
jgi:parallel beta-helix repeat protein